MSALARAPAAERASSEQTTDARRRADRQRGERARVTASESENVTAAPPRAAYSITNLTPPAAAAQPGQEAPAQLPAPAAEPQPGGTTEQPSAREVQTAAAQSPLEDARDAPALIHAFAAAPPTVKAQASGQLGERLTAAMTAETSALSSSTPEIVVHMNGTEAAPAGEFAAPVVANMTLGPVAPAAPAPEAVVGSPIQTEGEFQANHDVTGGLQSSFNAEFWRGRCGTGALWRANE